MSSKYYAVKVGKTPGIYTSWEDCKGQVEGVSGAKYKGFKSLEEAEHFLDGGAFRQLSLFDDHIIESKKIPSDTENATAYVDGSYNDATKQFSYGMVIFYGGKELHFSQMIEDEELAGMRNVAGEIKGAQAAMEFALENGCKNLTIYHDYEGIAKWCLGLWKTNKAGTRAYKEFYDNAKKHLNIEFIKVKGHSNDKYNDLADELAKSAIF